MIFSALLPIFCIIAIGFTLSRLPMSSAAGWAEIERFTYYLFFPSLLLLQLADSRFDWDELVDIAKVVGAALLALTIFFIVFRKNIASDLSSLSSVFQGSIRFNTYIGLAVIDAVYGERGLAAAALCLAVYVPLVNVLSVVSLSLEGESGAKRIYIMVGSVLSNPLVIACLLGIGLSYNSIRMPELVQTLLGFLSQPALPLGLLAVGAGIRFATLGEQTGRLVIASFNKFALFPGLILGGCIFFELSTLLATVLLLLTALPAPPSAYILAKQLGGNESLMANIITSQTLVAFLLIPVWIEIADRVL